MLKIVVRKVIARLPKVNNLMEIGREVDKYYTSHRLSNKTESNNVKYMY
jgi:hypothetical protein